jgi:diaminopimelate epimerase
MIEFTKCHGAGNDYLFIDCLDSPPPSDPAGLSVRMSERHFGAGADGIVLILPPSDAGNHCRMRMFNADGSEAEMCGNAIRCVAKLVHDRGRIAADPLKVETGAGVLTLKINMGKDGKVESARVDMGRPKLSPSEAGVNLPGQRVLEHPLKIEDREFRINCVSMGNPHAVIFLDEPVEDFPVERYGRVIENHPLFPRRTNVEFVNVRGSNLLRQRTWERGSGETLACGTGASAVSVASILTGRCAPGEVTVDLNGGRLVIEWREGENVFMTGPAVTVYTGIWSE